MALERYEVTVRRLPQIEVSAKIYTIAGLCAAITLLITSVLQQPTDEPPTSHDNQPVQTAPQPPELANIPKVQADINIPIDPIALEK